MKVADQTYQIRQPYEDIDVRFGDIANIYSVDENNTMIELHNGETHLVQKSIELVTLELNERGMREIE